MKKAPIVWLLSDGKVGHENPLIGVADAMGARFELRRVSPRRLFGAFAPFGPIDPRDGGANGPLAGPYPDICMASGRRTVPYLRLLKKRSPATFCVYFKDPRTRRSGADVLVTMAHDGLSGKDIIVAKTSPHLMSPAVLDAARDRPIAAIAALASPRVAVLIGGDSRHHTFSETDNQELIGHLTTLRSAGASLMITVSRRTPLDLQEKIFALGAFDDVVIWDGREPNPIAHFLAQADAVVVTSDSINMVGEAAATGKPIHLFHPTGSHPKFTVFLKELSEVATIRALDGSLAGQSYDPVDSTSAVAAQIMHRFSANTRW